MNEDLNLRDFFAGQALAGLMAAGETPDGYGNDVLACARSAYALADAMIEQREK